MSLLCRLGIHQWQRTWGHFAIILQCMRCGSKRDI